MYSIPRTVNYVVPIKKFRLRRAARHSNRPGTGFGRGRGRGRERPKFGRGRELAVLGFGRGREFFLKYGNCVELVVSRTTNFTYVCISKVKHEYNLYNKKYKLKL